MKFLFTTEKLSVQVHPDDDYARVHHNSLGKTEMWYLLTAEPGAKIAAGFRETITAERLREASLSGEIENLLQWFDVAPGDTFYIPAGTVHAIGAGLTLCEIQQHSDVTYRLYDYGRPRELHLDRAVEVSHLGPCAARRESVSCPYFITSKLSISNATDYVILARSGELLIVIEGSGVLDGQASRAGDVWSLDGDARFSGDAAFLQVLAL